MKCRQPNPALILSTYRVIHMDGTNFKVSLFLVIVRINHSIWIKQIISL